MVVRSTTRGLDAITTTKPTVTGDYADVGDPVVLDWLVKRSIDTKSASSMRWYDVMALRQNRWLSPANRSDLERVSKPMSSRATRFAASRTCRPQSAPSSDRPGAKCQCTPSTTGTRPSPRCSPFDSPPATSTPRCADPK